MENVKTLQFIRLAYNTVRFRAIRPHVLSVSLTLKGKLSVNIFITNQLKTHALGQPIIFLCLLCNDIVNS